MLTTDSFTLTPEQQDQILTDEINKRIRKGGTLLTVDEGNAIIRYGREQGALDLAYLVTLWSSNILMSIATLGLWAIGLAMAWAMFRKTWRKMEGIQVHTTGQVQIHHFGKTISYWAENKLRNQATTR